MSGCRAARFPSAMGQEDSALTQSGTPGSSAGIDNSTQNIRTPSGDFVSRRSLRTRNAGTAGSRTAKASAPSRSTPTTRAAVSAPSRHASAKRAPATPRKKMRGFLNVVVMTITAGLVAAMAIPAYAMTPGTTDGTTFSASALSGLKNGNPQSLSVSGTALQATATRDAITATTEAELAAQKAAQAQAAADAERAAQSSAAAASGSLTVSGDARQLAQTLMAAYEAGNFTTYQPAIITSSVGAIANGTVSSECAVDTRILQILVLTLNQFGSVGITDLNRPCVGNSVNCSFSSHCVLPNRAVDFSRIGGASVNGSNAATIQLLRFLDGIVPAGSNAGQSDCRAGAGDSIALARMAQFADLCTHQHIDIPL